MRTIIRYQGTVLCLFGAIQAILLMQCAGNVSSGGSDGNCSAGYCLNGGTCEDGIAQYTCHCPTGFDGINCEIIINQPTTDTITHYGITWTFDKKYPYGQFANGDYWVVGPANIIGIDPPSIPTMGITTLSGFTPTNDTGAALRTMNGSEINPVPGIVVVNGVVQNIFNGSYQGYDSEMYCWHPIEGKIYGPGYNSDLNVAIGISESNPLVLLAGQSLVSTISLQAGGRPQLADAAVLTVLSSAPASGSFRPAYSGTDKTINFNISDIDYDLLPSLSLAEITHDPTSGTTVAAIVSKMKRVWLDHFDHASDGTSFSSPTNNMPNYGREYGALVGEASLLLMCDETQLINKYGVTKKDIAIGLIQIGIDSYGVLKNNGYWMPNGGLNGGRKWPILLAGILLNDSNMKSVGFIDTPWNLSPLTLAGIDFTHTLSRPFMEDAQTSYISPTEYDATHIPYWGDKSHSPYVGPDKRDTSVIPYEVSDYGLPEWGIRGEADPTKHNKFWDSSYRRAETTNGRAGIMLSALILESGSSAKTLWNWPAFFDYQDRYMAVETKGSWIRQWSIFTEDMWDAYRANYGECYIGLVNNVRQYGACEAASVVK